jgi:hypothetical protein
MQVNKSRLFIMLVFQVDYRDEFFPLKRSTLFPLEQDIQKEPPMSSDLPPRMIPGSKLEFPLALPLTPTRLECLLTNSLTQTVLLTGMAVGVAEGAREVGS